MAKTKHDNHREKESLGGAWQEGRPFFNKVSGSDKADFLIMVRFTSTEEHECFIIPIKAAEKLTNWFANELVLLGKSTSQLFPFVGTRERTTIYAFNRRVH